jgi:uncharacterized membrane protein YedE/YeeE
MPARIRLGDQFALCVACLLAMQPSRLHGQCIGEATSCLQCHEMQANRPVLGSTEAWHRDHSFGDLCASCHGGQPGQAERTAAHTGLRDPLADSAVSCAPCHAEDWAQRAERYVTLQSAAAIAAAPPRPPGPGTPLHIASKLDGALAAVAVVLGIAVACTFLAREPRRFMRRAQWSPYVTGAGLGLTLSISMVAFGRPLTVSAAFDELAGHLAHAVAPEAPRFAQSMPRALSWNVWLVIGLLGGAFLSAALSRTFRPRLVPDERWSEAFGDRVWLRWLVAFVGACLVQLGAAIAGGCTSGLAISGGAVMAPAAFLFMLGMFGGGIPTAMLLYARKRGSR